MRPVAKLASDGGADDSHRASNGIAARARSAAWIVVATEYRAEADAARYLDHHGFDARQFLVQTRRPALGKRPASWATEHAFPGYLIVRLHPTDPLHWLRPDSRNGVAGWLHAVGAADAPATLPDATMLALLDMAARNAWTGETLLLGQIDLDGRLVAVPRPAEAAPDLTGETLLVEDHPWLAGMRGECLRSGRDRVTLLLRLLGGEREVTLARAAVRRP